jgi:uncharacterized coiled-coil protein SlyX
MDVWDIVKNVISWLWIPIGIYLTYRRNIDDREQARLDNMEQRLMKVEQQTLLNDSQIEDIRLSLRETKDNIKEVKQGVDKLIERLIK